MVNRDGMTFGSCRFPVTMLPDPGAKKEASGTLNGHWTFSAY